MMERKQQNLKELGVCVQYSIFAPEGKLEEVHAILKIVDNINEPFVQQYQRIFEAQKQFESEIGCSNVILKRYFVSDATNQMALMETGDNVSVIQQAPLNGSKIAVWIYLQKGTSNYTHFWTMNLTEPEGDSFHQSKVILERYEEKLQKEGMTLADNCIRTWFFVRDVDTQYKGLVVARKENFKTQGLTDKTHYIASTGIQGMPANPKAIIQLGAYAIKEVKKGQQTYLYAPTHLNPTYEYGVTFERGVKVAFGDRSHIYISGTASIDNKGQVLYEGDIKKQATRMWENVETLLNEGNASFDDVAQIVVYLRDVADYNVVHEMFNNKLPDIPTIITYAPVCRPKWLIEMECIAITNRGDRQFKDL